MQQLILKSKSIKFLILIIPLVFNAHLQIYGQNQEITVAGTVTSMVDQEPLPGVSVLIKGTTTGTITDVDGNYSLKVPSPASVLVFSFVGYTSEEVTVGDQTRIDIPLSEDITSLGEVVVIGYQTIEKEDLTGAVAKVNVSESQRVSANSLAESLQGLTPGLTVRNNGNPGTGAQIEIRGTASFLNSSPLYVIDGMIADAGGVLMNTNDIESIQVLKDASAAAIYGSRAANGVIIITTKQGTPGDMKVSVGAKYGISEMPATYDVMDAQEYASLKRQAYLNSGLTPASSVGNDDSFVPPYDTDWKEQTVQTGHQQDYNVSLSGGHENSTYMVSSSFYKHDGVIKGYEFNRGSFRVNTQSERGKFTFGENFVATLSNVQNPQGFQGGIYDGNAFYDMLAMLPVIPVRDEEYISDINPGGWGIGSADAETYFFNSPAIRAINSYNSNTVKAVGNVYLQYEIADWLRYKLNVGGEARFIKNKHIKRDGIWRYTQQPGPTYAHEGRTDWGSWLFEHTFNFNKFFGKHDINGVLGYSSQETKITHLSGRRTALQALGNGEYLEEINSALGEASTGGSVGQHFRIQGFLGRINYTFDERYQITLTGRYDQDSRFSKDLRSKFFPAAAVAWQAHNESFFDIPRVSQLKLRASYGELGIVTVGSWDNIALINTNQRYVFGPNQTQYVGANQPQLTNPDLRWEVRKMSNVGVDVGMFENRLEVSAEWYRSVSEDALINQVLPSYLGNLGGNPPVNAGSIENTGIELAVKYSNEENAVRWTVGGNLTTIKNTVLSVGNQGEDVDYIQTGVTRSQVGRSIGEWYLLKTNGLFQSEEEVNNYVNSEGVVIQPNAKPGDIRFVDLNDDGVINQEDRDFAGSPWPNLQTGIQLGIGHGQFNLSAQFVGVFGNVLYNDVIRVLDSYQTTNFRRDVKPWTPEAPNTSDPRIGIATNDPGLADNARNDSDRWLESGSYFRLRNIELSYLLPKNSIDKIGLRNLRFYISAQNLFTLTKYTGADPDVTGAGVHLRGADTGNWPSDKIYSAGIQFEF